MVFFGGNYGFECFWPFPFMFLISVRRTSHRHTGFWSVIKGRGSLQVVVSFLFVLTWWQLCICSDVVWSKDLSVYFFCFLLIFDRKFFFLFCFLPIFDWEFSSFAFFRSLIENFFFILFSFEGKDGHSHPGSRFMVSWDFGSRLVERLDMIYVRVLDMKGLGVVFTHGEGISTPHVRRKRR